MPRRAPFDLFESKQTGDKTKPFVRRVFNMDGRAELVLKWLNFAQGAVDSTQGPAAEYVPRNSAAESGPTRHQQEYREACVEVFVGLADKTSDYKKSGFYEQFGKCLPLDSFELGQLIEEYLVREETVSAGRNS